MRLIVSTVAFLFLAQASDVVAQTPNSSAGQYFYNQASFATSAGAGGVVITDVNGDGRADLVVASSNDQSISVQLGQADGTLGAKSDTVLAEGPNEIVTGDFNGDGKVDLAVTQYSGVAVLLGNGDGTFKAPATIALANPAGFMASADVNKDGRADLIAVGSCGTTCGFASVLLGKGDGTFTAQPAFSTGGVPWGFVVFDANKDGVLDLAFANSSSNSVNGGTPGMVSVLMGNGDGSFKAPVSYSSGANIAGIAAGDVTGDGSPDLIVSHYFNQTLTLLKGNGDGTFQAETGLSSDTAFGSQFLQLLDLNRDGKMDLIVNSVFNGGPTVLMGNGDGTFQEPQVYSGGSGYFFAIGDVNGDGNVDLAATGGNQVYVLLGNGDGTFSPRTDLPLGSSQVTLSAGTLGDFNGDGKQDIAATTQTGDVAMLAGKGDGTFQTATAAGAVPYWNFGQLAAGDFNKDGHLDLIGNGTTLLPGKGDGTFGTGVTVNSDSNIRSFAVGDFNGDGNLDILDVGNGFFESQPVQLLLGNGDGTFQTARRFWNLRTIPDKAAVGDFNKDGKLDLALTVNPNGVAILLGDGAGGFADPVMYATDDLPDSIVVADVNHDGVLDIIATGGKVDVFLGKGDGTFPTRVDYAVAGFPANVAVGDFNGDGKLDLATTSYGSGPGYLGVLFGNGDGTFQNPVTVSATGSGLVLVSDFNGDGVDDPLLMSGQGSLFLSAPLVTVSPSQVNFGTVAAGAATPSETITVTNSGNGPLNITVPAPAASFSITGTVCQAAIPRLDSCTIPVFMNAATAGAQTAQVQIQTNVRNARPVVLLTGTAVVPLLTVSPTNVDFGSGTVGVASDAKTITLTNASQVAIAIQSVTATGPFKADSQCGATLAAASSCNIAVTFTATASGAQSGSVTITDNSSGSPQSISLTGTGVAALSIAPQTGGSLSATVTSGSTASFALGVAAGPGFSGTVTLACSGAPTYATCTLSPSSVTLSSNQTATFSATVTTSQTVAQNTNWNIFGTAGGSGLLLSVLLVPAFRRKWRTLAALVCLVALSGAAVVTGCGGGGSSAPSQPTSHNVAPGTYTLTVTATSGSVSSSQKLTLTVQ